VLTFDNLGEASELERDTWDGPLGQHESVTVALPRLLDELAMLGLTGTFFVEGLNCELYPDALREIVARGHELGVHGWRHEQWAQLAPERERELLTRSGGAFASLGLEARAFRPPGGEPTAHTGELLRELGYRWWSPEAGHAGGPPMFPFEWELVDAYYLMERFGTPVGATEAVNRMTRRLASGSGAQVVVLHPFLMLEPAWWTGARRVLRAIAEPCRALR
jgi:peptidoglycan/xylan/chitin deacetylase (PgdA/CDA1 family)